MDDRDKALELFANPIERGRAKVLLAQSREVAIRRNDENGEWMWAIEAMVDREFWFNAFLTRADAERWATEVGLVVVKVEP